MGALLLLLLLLPLPPPSAPGVTCSAPAAIEHADIQVKSFQEGSRERYSCFSGFKRKAGTSSLTECVYNQTTGTARWTRPTLKCIHAPTHEAAHNTKVLLTVPFIVLCGLVLCGLCYLRLRQRSRPQGAEMENSEGLPMTTVPLSAEEDPGNQSPDLGDPTNPPAPL